MADPSQDPHQGAPSQQGVSTPARRGPSLEHPAAGCAARACPAPQPVAQPRRRAVHLHTATRPHSVPFAPRLFKSGDVAGFRDLCPIDPQRRAGGVCGVVLSACGVVVWAVGLVPAGGPLPGAGLCPCVVYLCVLVATARWCRAWSGFCSCSGARFEQALRRGVRAALAGGCGRSRGEPTAVVLLRKARMRPQT